MEIKKTHRFADNLIFDYITYNCPNFEFSFATIKCQKKEAVSKHTHDQTEIIFLKDGNLKFHYEDKTLSVKPNDLIVTPPHIYHFYETQENSVHNKIVFQIKTSTFFKNSNFDKIKKTNISDNLILSSIFKRFEYYIKNYNKPVYDGCVDTIMECLAQELVINLNGIEENTFTQTTTHPLLSSILTYLNQNLAQIYTLEDITKVFYISENYLHKLFKTYLQISPLNYINQKKITLAKSLLNNGQSLSNIAEQCGFNSYTSFYRCYKKHFGTNPAKLKEK